MKILQVSKLILILFLFVCFSGYSQDTELKYLSGTGSDDTVDWQFFVTEGMNSGEWTTIPVPSNWELFGFGTYNYGDAKGQKRAKEVGLYKHEFRVPAEWMGKQVEIVLEGSMTDTEVKINGTLAGPVHQGSFYRFKYDVSDLINYGEKNLLEVRVAKHSANESVNLAERHADFWNFGGIYRPVYLEAKPNENIERIAVDGQADGSFNAEVFLNNIRRADQITGQVMSLDNDPVGSPFSVKIANGAEKVRLQTQLKDIKTWNPEYPNLYRVVFKLSSNGNVIHQMKTRFGFRTIEKRDRDGIYVNGVKIKFKGVNRHTFWPTTGRASNKTRSILDAKLIKDMNMNAVRMSHYPPNTHFLDVCDSLGLFVINELTGWHAAYDTEVGSKLVKEMVTRDVNHPSIILWSNGNEGGHNTDLDPLFKKYDIQDRVVIHPWETFNGISTDHYRAYNYGTGTYWNGHNIVLPTEFLHGMYDGGSGAGLYDYWEMIWDNPRAAGGFLWVFADEGVVRTDKNGKIDTHGSSAADGILGPFHQKEGSFFAIKEIFSPVHFQDEEIGPEFDQSFNIENRYFYTNLKECSFNWKLAKMPLPNEKSLQKEATGTIKSPDLEPGQSGQLDLELPQDWFTYDVLYITAHDRKGNKIYEWSWAISFPDNVVREMLSQSSKKGSVTLTQEQDVLLVQAGEITFTIGKDDGLLKKVVNSEGEIPFNDGPVLSAGKTIFKAMEIERKGDTISLICSFEEESKMKEFTWTFYPSGWAKLKIYYFPEEYDVRFDYMGVDFSYPEKLVKGVRWLGHGPYHVWKNRMQGVELGVHQKDYNNTITGVPPVVYPEFKGYHSDLYWAKFQTKEQAFTVATSSEDVFLRLYTPDQPEKVYERTAPPFPSGDISFMQAIPAIGSKTNDPENMGPSGRKNMFFDYGPFDDWLTRSKIMTLFFNFSANQDNRQSEKN